MRGALPGLAVLALALLPMLTACLPAGAEQPADGRQARLPGFPGPQSGDSADEVLAALYAPILYLKQQSGPCDADGEPYVPAPVSVVLGRADIVLRNTMDRDFARQGPTAEDLFLKGPTYYLDYAPDPRSPDCAYEQSFLSAFVGEQPTAYAHITTEPGEEGLSLQYWFFYYFNDWNNRHEGDWEGIQLIFSEDSAEAALRSEPQFAVYSQHGGAEKAKWSSSKVRKEEGRPVVYPSAGSHASYFAPDLYLGKGEAGTGFGCDDATGPYRRVALEARVVPGGVLDRNSEYAWVSYFGRWGQALPGQNNGPTGPNTKTNWNEPISWADEEARTSSLTVPGHEIFATSPVQLFCTVVSRGSQLLFVLTDRGPLALGLAVLLVGAFGYAGFETVRDARRTAHMAAGGAVEFHRVRGFGEILGTAAVVYHRHGRLFVGVTAGLIPAGVLLALLQQVLLQLQIFKTILSVADDRGLSTLATLIYGTGMNLLLLLLTGAGVITCMADLDHGQDPSIRRAYRTVLKELPDLILARIRATLIVTLCFISVVGIPWGINRFVSWYFMEQQILIDGVGRREAARASAAVVEGDWWRTLVRTAVLGFLGAFAAPLAFAILLLLTSTPLWMLNVLSSVGYALLLPFVAIALTLTFWDLKERRKREIATADSPQQSQRGPSGRVRV